MRYFTFFVGLILLLFFYKTTSARGIPAVAEGDADLPVYSGFNITDFSLNRSFFDGSNYELTSSYALLKENAVLGWVHNFYPPSNMFELYIAFEADPLLSVNVREAASLHIQTGIGTSADPLGVTLSHVSGTRTGLYFSNQITPASVPLNLFDRKKHSIRIIVNRVKGGKDEDTYILSYIIDDKYKGKTKEEFSVFNNTGSSNVFIGPFIAPSIAYTNTSRQDMSSPTPSAKILNWSFNPSQRQSAIANSTELDNYASYIFINGKKQYMRMVSHDARNFNPKKGKIDYQISGHVAYKESVYNESKCEAYFVFRFSDVNNASHKVVEYGQEGGDKRSVSLSATINYFGNQACIGSVINEGGNLSSVDGSGSVQVQNVVGFNGMRGKQIDFTNISLRLSDKMYPVSGRFFSFDRTDRVPQSDSVITVKPAIPAQASKLVSFCGGKYKLQDEYTAEEPNFHKYELSRVICNKKDNPFCTVNNVFKHMLSNVNYMAPATLDAYIYPEMTTFIKNEFYEIRMSDNPFNVAESKPEYIKIEAIEKFRKADEVLKRRNQGDNVCDCKVTKLLGPGDLTNGSKDFAEQIMRVLDPTIYSGIIYGTNESPIINSVYPTMHTIVNRTLSGHFLYPGKVTRTVVEKDGQVIVNTEGVGTTAKSTLNTVVGKLLFESIDNNLWLDFNIVAQSPKLQKQVINQTCPEGVKSPTYKTK